MATARCRSAGDRLLGVLAQATSVVWVAGSRSVPNWLSDIRHRGPADRPD